MKKTYTMLLIPGLVLFSNLLFSQTAPPPYEIGTWSGFKATAINYTFDDGCPNQFEIAIPLFNEFGFRITLFTVSDWVTNWPALQVAADSGHEVASHTVTHPNFGNVSLQQQFEELQSSKNSIESHITTKKCKTIAYPFCVPGNDSACGSSYISARGCQGFIEPKTPSSYLNVSSIGVGNLSSVNILSDFKSKFTSAAKINGWCVFTIHGIDNDGGYSPITSAELRKSVEYLSERKSKFWVTTFENATLYSKERNAAKVAETSASDTLFTLQLTDSLPDSIYNHPISLRRPLPQNWPSADVMQDNKNVLSRIVLVDSVVYLIFDVVPDAGEVKIIKNLRTVTPDVDTISTEDPEPIGFKQLGKGSLDFAAIYFQGKLIISLPNSDNNELDVYLYDIRSIKMFSKRSFYLSENQISIFINRNLKPEIYFVSHSDKKNIWSKKLIIS